MARYYGEKQAASDDRNWYSKSYRRSKTEMLLSPEFWKGQQEGSRSHEVHARGMRPLCEVIPAGPSKQISVRGHYTHLKLDLNTMEASPNNMVLFVSRKQSFEGLGTELFQDAVSSLGDGQSESEVSKDR